MCARVCVCVLNHSQKLEKHQTQPTHLKFEEVSVVKETLIIISLIPNARGTLSNLAKNESKAQSYEIFLVFPMWVETQTQRQTEAQWHWQFERRVLLKWQVRERWVFQLSNSQTWLLTRNWEILTTIWCPEPSIDCRRATEEARPQYFLSLLGDSNMQQGDIRRSGHNNFPAQV